MPGPDLTIFELRWVDDPDAATLSRHCMWVAAPDVGTAIEHATEWWHEQRGALLPSGERLEIQPGTAPGWVGRPKDGFAEGVIAHRHPAAPAA